MMIQQHIAHGSSTMDMDFTTNSIILSKHTNDNKQQQYTDADTTTHYPLLIHNGHGPHN